MFARIALIMASWCFVEFRKLRIVELGMFNCKMNSSEGVNTVKWGEDIAVYPCSIVNDGILDYFRKLSLWFHAKCT